MRIAEDVAHCRDPGGGFVAIAIESLLRMRHVPHAILNGTRTWSPIFRFSMSSPSCSTMPVNSWPNVIPTMVSGTNPLYRCRSDPQIRDRVTRTMAS